jgi:hypothetical protein
LLDTVKHFESTEPSHFGEHGQQVKYAQDMAELKGMVASAIALLQKQANPTQPETAHLQAANAAPSARASLPPLEGHWFVETSGSHLYARVIGTQLVAPYCYGGNDELTAVYFDWRPAGEYWFARFDWFQAKIAGFAFIKQQSPTHFSGAWWGDESAGADIARAIGQPPERSGEPLRLTRGDGQKAPEWAESFFSEVERHGLVKAIARQKANAKPRKK